MMQKIKKLPLFRKVLLFSFLITFLVAVSTAGISFILHSKLLEDQIEERVEGLSSLWSTTINTEDIFSVKEFQDLDNPALGRLVKNVSLINERNAAFVEAYILDPEIHENSSFYVLAASKHYNDLGLENMSYYKGGEEFTKTFKTVINEDRASSTGVYKDQYGTWITAFSPIKDERGNVIALLGVDAEASFVGADEKKITAILIYSFLIITIIVYFLLSWGLKKVIEPINEIIYGINEVSSGNFNVRLQIEEFSDLKKLAERFNMMTRQLSILFDRLSATSQQLGPPPKRQDPMQWEAALDEMENIFQKTKFQQELQRAEKMNAIGQLAASVAHEIRNPMTVVKGFLQIFLAKESMSDEERMYIKLMIEEMNRAETIINDYLSLAKPDLKQIEQVDGAELASKVVDLMNSYAMMSKNIDMAIHISEPIMVRGNKSELNQVLINILKNGIEAMKEGGKLTLTLKEEGDYGVFIISDTGIGMSEEALKRLGTAFYSLKEKGTGIGLMVCYQIIERMKGKIEVESKEGEGTTFRIYVPLFSAKEQE
ncbi:two-component sensor histidine kinase [Bacillus canaveralius]|uniref:histidine kinase n=1 Tax=Bacillus canaveralius TaxID=1403243 RepID=A0A2N5GJ16_9BACI|nr:MULTISPECIES: HAMP domain-containing sensor histidine kinase [Bacillus]PLR81052.1 two-component sensor histidine kinase [Bacillus canaveralius]PLR82755.1 two-component sensor histidine kinase [Bacillus sp. V33-4]PLR98974.1 two-component sensor histidine kinase [Bacillus canaveralius]